MENGKSPGKSATLQIAVPAIGGKIFYDTFEFFKGCDRMKKDIIFYLALSVASCFKFSSCRSLLSRNTRFFMCHSESRTVYLVMPIKLHNDNRGQQSLWDHDESPDHRPWIVCVCVSPHREV